MFSPIIWKDRPIGTTLSTPALSYYFIIDTAWFYGLFQVTNDPGNRYNIPLINALVLYVGTQAIATIQAKGMSPSTTTIAHSSHMDIFQNLAVDLDTEGQFYQLAMYH